jgi:hypothetical protein
LVACDEFVPPHAKLPIEDEAIGGSLVPEEVRIRTKSCFGEFQGHWRTFTCEARMAELEKAARPTKWTGGLRLKTFLSKTCTIASGFAS